MKPVIIVSDADLQNKEDIKLQLQSVSKPNQLKGMIEINPKAKKATEVIRILRENGILYQIRFNMSN